MKDIVAGKPMDELAANAIVDGGISIVSGGVQAFTIGAVGGLTLNFPVSIGTGIALGESVSKVLNYYANKLELKDKFRDFFERIKEYLVEEKDNQ